MRYILLFVCFVYINAQDISVLLSKIDYLTKQTSQNFQDIKVNYDPFVQSKKIVQKKKNLKKMVRLSTKQTFSLVTIFNDRAFINSKWYKKGDTIYGYKIVDIGDDKVLLSKESKLKYLRIKKINNLLKVEKRK